MSAYVKGYDSQTEWMHFLIDNYDLLNKYNTIWDKVSSDIKREFDSEPAYNKNCLKTKIKSFGYEATDFYDKEIAKLSSNHPLLAVITIDSVLKINESYHPQAFLKKCKFIEKKNINHIIEDMNIFCSNSDEE